MLEEILSLLSEGYRNTLVMIIDMQNCFLSNLSPEERKRLIKNQCQVIRLCKDFGIPLAVIRYIKCGKLTRKIRRALRSIQDRKKFYVIKKHNNAFLETSLHNQLRFRGIKRLVVMGVSATLCVFETIEQAVKNDYLVVTSEDIIGDWRPPALEEICRDYYRRRIYFFES